MPLFKKHHDAPVDSTNYQSTGMNDPAYAGQPTSGYPTNTDTYSGGAHPSGVGAPIDNSYGTQGAPHHGHPGATTAGGTAVGAAAGHELGGHAGPGTAVGGMTGNHASHQYNQPVPGSGYADQPGAFNSTTTSHHPVRNEVGGAALGAEAGHHMGGHGTTGAAAGGLAGREHAYDTTGSVHNTTGTTTSGTAGNMTAKDAKSLEMKGKAQQLAGMVLSSQSMKAKGNAKEQEAAAIRHHQTNVAEAEAHEAQARLARERAGPAPSAYH